MHIKHLEYLVALSREQHFARAAAVCGVTQPTLSEGIKQLEQSLGALIVARGHRFHGFTPDGERVLMWARRIIADVDALQQELSERRGDLAGHLRVGVVPAALPMVGLLTLPFARRFPRATISVMSLTSIEIDSRLEDFALDAGITYLDNEPLTNVRPVPLYRERYVLLTPQDSPVAGREAIGWREAADLPLCLLTPDNQGRRIVDAIFRQAGVVAKPRIETNSLVTLCTHPRLGTVSSVLPEVLVTALGTLPGVRAIPLVEPTASHSVGLIVPDRDLLAPVAAALVAIAATSDIEASLQPIEPSHIV